MTTSQITAWLEAMPDAARLLDAEGILIAQNVRAQGQQPQEKQLEIYGLGDGLRLETWKTIQVAEPDVRALANGLAHTLRNPLSSIMTAADLVRDDPHVGEESAMLLEIIAKESRQLNRILTDFLNYVRPRALPPSTFDLAAALRDTIRALQQENRVPDSIEVRDEIGEKLPVYGDENAIRQSLRNVVLNSVEAMGGRGMLRLSGEKRNEEGNTPRSRIHVEDNGPGFTRESLQRAFEPFFSHTPDCAGLGLSVAMASVEKAGGRISVENIASVNTPKNVSVPLTNAQIEYSIDATKSSANVEQQKTQPVVGARVCIELNSTDTAAFTSQNDDETSNAETSDEVTTV